MINCRSVRNCCWVPATNSEINFRTPNFPLKITNDDKFWVLLLAVYRLLGWRQNVDDARMVPFRNNGIFTWADGIALTQDLTPCCYSIKKKKIAVQIHMIPIPVQVLILIVYYGLSVNARIVFFRPPRFCDFDELLVFLKNKTRMNNQSI